MSDLVVESFPVAELRTYHRNPRRGNVAAIAESLQTRGQYRPIVVNRGSVTGRPFEVLAGNHTLAAAVSLGWSHIQATTVDVDDDAAAQIVLADNRLADLGGYDDADLLAVLRDAGDLSGTGYAEPDVAALVAALDEPVALTDVDDAPPVADADLVSRVGDVWQLGVHTLVVGSSSDSEAVLAAAPGVADCVWTDPPYGVSYVGKTADALTIQNDGADDAVAVFCGALSSVLAVARGGAPVYIAHAEQLRDQFMQALIAAGVVYRQTLVWVKDALVLGRSDYQWRHEPILESATPPPARC